MPYQVLKPIPVNDGVIAPGEIVDAEGWRNLRTLISGRYLSPEPVAAKAAGKSAQAAPAPQDAAAPEKAAKAKRTTPTSTDEE